MGDTGFNLPGVTVSEADGNPKRRPVQELVFPNGTVTISGTKATIGAAGGALIILHDSGTSTVYNPASDTDTARGTALLAALAALVSGETLIIGPGTFDCGSAQVNFPPGTTSIGQGKYATIITSDYSNGGKNTFHLGNGTNVRHMRLDMPYTEGPTYHYGVGPSQSGTPGVSHTYCYLDYVLITGNTDGIYWDQPTFGIDDAAVVMTHCEVNSGYDCINNGGGGTGNLLYAYDCTFTATNTGLIDTTVYSACKMTTGAAYFDDCTFVATGGGSSTNVGGVIGILIVLKNCNVSTSGTGTVYDLDAGGSGTITVTVGTTYDRTKTNGTLAHYDLDLGTNDLYAGTLNLIDAGQSLIQSGLKVNVAGGGNAADSFIVDTDTITAAFKVDAPTDKICPKASLWAGTTSQAPLRFTAGTNLTTPLNGAVEFDGTDFFVTI